MELSPGIQTPTEPEHNRPTHLSPFTSRIIRLLTETCGNESQAEAEASAVEANQHLANGHSESASMLALRKALNVKVRLYSLGNDVAEARRMALVIISGCHWPYPTSVFGSGFGMADPPGRESAQSDYRH